MSQYASPEQQPWSGTDNYGYPGVLLPKWPVIPRILSGQKLHRIPLSSALLFK